MSLNEVCKRLVRLRVNVTACRQQLFKCHCEYCKARKSGYPCKLYSDYVQAWMDLQEEVGRIEAEQIAEIMGEEDVARKIQTTQRRNSLRPRRRNDNPRGLIEDSRDFSNP